MFLLSWLWNGKFWFQFVFLNSSELKHFIMFICSQGILWYGLFIHVSYSFRLWVFSLLNCRSSFSFLGRNPLLHTLQTWSQTIVIIISFFWGILMRCFNLNKIKSMQVIFIWLHEKRITFFIRIENLKGEPRRKIPLSCMQQRKYFLTGCKWKNVLTLIPDSSFGPVVPLNASNSSS